MNFYICDRKARKNCMDTCNLTSRIEHAKNFKKINEDYIELDAEEKLGRAFRDGLLASGKMV